jgi:hypothetical protein
MGEYQSKRAEDVELNDTISGSFVREQGEVESVKFNPHVQELGGKAVAEWFAHRINDSAFTQARSAEPVERYELPGIDAFNFILHDALGGGGISSLRFDPQGKAYGQQLLDMPVRMPAAWLAHPSLAEVPEVRDMRRALGVERPQRDALGET